MKQKSLYTTVPRQHREITIVHTGFRAGPGFMAGKDESFDPPRPLKEALQWLEGFRQVYRAGQVQAANGTTLWFDCDGFTKMDVRGDPPKNRLNVGGAEVKNLLLDVEFDGEKKDE